MFLGYEWLLHQQYSPALPLVTIFCLQTLMDRLAEGVSIKLSLKQTFILNTSKFGRSLLVRETSDRVYEVIDPAS